MYLVSYLAHDDAHLSAVQERLAMAAPPLVLVAARTLPELINQVHTLPLRLVVADLSWPRATWEQFTATLRETHPTLPVLALTAGETEEEWWRVADDLLRLDTPLELFHFRVRQAIERAGLPDSAIPSSPAVSAPPSMHTEAPSLLENSQFRTFAEVFTRRDEPAITEAFVAWVQQACQTGRAVLLLQDPATGDYVCAAHRGLPSSLVSHCRFPQTATLCRWLASTGRILLREGGAGDELSAGLDLLQATAALPILFDGRLVGILGIGPRLIGTPYSAVELEGLFALGSELALAVQHCRMHQALQQQQEMTEHMLSEMPSGTIVLGDDGRIAFVNQAAATMLGKTCGQLHGQDLRALPTPLGDIAYGALASREGQPRVEIAIGPTRRPLAATTCVLATTPPSALLLLEDLSAQQELGVERERRVNLEVLTNLVHFLAHELRNPLVALSTFSALVPTRAADPDFQEFCSSVLQGEIGRVNLLIEQLLVLTNHAEFSFATIKLGPLLEKVTDVDDLRQKVVMALPLVSPELDGDSQRLETGLTCLLRSMLRFAQSDTPVTLRVETQGASVVLHTEVPAIPEKAFDGMLDPWEQFFGKPEQDVDLGLATAHYIVTQHHGTMEMSVDDHVLTVVCRLPVRTLPSKEGSDDVEQSTRRRR